LVQRIVALANQLRQKRPNQYGVKGTKPGNPGYVKDGWKNAVKTATDPFFLVSCIVAVLDLSEVFVNT